MRRPSNRSARCRAVIAVAALYGLLLQVFLVSLAPLPAFAGDGVLCAAHQDAPADPGTPCPQQLCCLAAHLAQPLAVPVPWGAVVAVRLPRVAAPIRPVAAVPPARGPPLFTVGPRGPPVA